MRRRVLGWLAVVGCVAAGCGGHPAIQRSPEVSQTDRPAAVPPLRVRHAVGFRVEYGPNYKRVMVGRPWRGATTGVQYLLLRRGTPRPAQYRDLPVIEIPVRRIVTLSSTYLRHLEILGLLDTWVGHSNRNWVTAPALRARVASRQVAEVGNNQDANVERLVELAPDLVMTFGTGDATLDAHERLGRAGVPVVLNAEYMEPTPLGQAEWLKYLALFFDREAEAERLFQELETRYQRLAARARGVRRRPTVFAGSSRNGVWYSPGGKSWLARCLADAGADYLWADDPTSGSIPHTFEAVFARAREAEFWVQPSEDWTSLVDVHASDVRYTSFAATRTRQVYNNNARVDATGNNEYWETGTSQPDRVLADLIAIFHPELLPRHSLFYYRRLSAARPEAPPS